MKLSTHYSTGKYKDCKIYEQILNRPAATLMSKLRYKIREILQMR